MYWLNSLRSKIKRVLKDPIADVVLNYSVEKAEEYYTKACKQWEQGDYQGWAKVDVHETEVFPFGCLEDAAEQAKLAQNLYNNMKKEDKPYIRKLDWYLYGQNFVVSWHRLKTWDEYLHDGIKDALEQAYKNAEGGARLILERETDIKNASNTDIHCFAEWIIDKETLERLSKYEPNTVFKGRDVEEDIKQCIKELDERMEYFEKKEECKTALAKKQTTLSTPIKAVEIKLEAENEKDEDELPKIVQEIMDLISAYIKRK